MFQADDVIDLATVKGVRLGDQAVFAQLICAISDVLA